MIQPKILVFAGSARKASYNKQLARVAHRFALEAGAEAEFIDLVDYRLPVFDEDLEEAEGAPAKASELKQRLAAAAGFIVASPEYNSSVSPLLKNTIDWLSREEPGVPGMAAFRGKTAGLLSASPGALGGMRGLVHLRDILGNIGVYLVPRDQAIPTAHEAFDAEGGLVRERDTAGVKGVVLAVVELARQRQAVS